MPIDFNRPGRIISGSKTSSKGHVCVFNANVCTKGAGKIWFGDIDLMTDADDLKALAASKGEAVYILREMDGRFQNEAFPKYDRAVATIHPNGKLLIIDRNGG